MVFSSLTFLCIFFPCVFIIYSVLPSLRLRNAFLIIASLYFYAYGEPLYIILMLASTILNWLAGICLKKYLYKKLILSCGIIANLALIAVFKYADLIFGTINYLAGTQIVIPGIELPIGISFYTFQAMSYIIDVYKKVDAQKKLF